MPKDHGASETTQVKKHDEEAALFGYTKLYGAIPGGQAKPFRHAAGRLSVILTPPERFLDMADDAIANEVIRDGLRLGFDLFPIMIDYRVVRYPSDFYSLEPGYERLRPAQQTPVPGLALAGDYTKQPFLANMEGRSFPARGQPPSFSIGGDIRDRPCIITSSLERRN